MMSGFSWGRPNKLINFILSQRNVYGRLIPRLRRPSHTFYPAH
jgi:hypothetical protein